MALVEPVPGAPAAVADCGDERALAVADYHAGIEAGLRYERGVELRSDADGRRGRLLALCDRVDPDRVVVLGDLVHRIGDPTEGDERDEVVALLDSLDVPLTLVPGNHDGGVAEAYGDRIEVADAGGLRRGDVGFVHGHTWPDRSVLGAATVCVGHEHPQVRLEDEVGGGRTEKAWLRGRLGTDPFAEQSTATEATGAPVFTDALAYADCTLHDTVAFGDHTIYVGHAQQVRTQQPTADPLTFFQGDWGTIDPAEND